MVTYGVSTSIKRAFKESIVEKMTLLHINSRTKNIRKRKLMVGVEEGGSEHIFVGRVEGEEWGSGK